LLSRARSVLLALALAGAAAAGGPAPLPRAPDAPVRVPGTVSFLAFGDAGTGGPGQRHVALSMSSVLASAPVDFALVLGDDFYPHGLSGVDDPLFEKAFASVYAPRSFAFPFYAVAGNHDHDGSVAALLSLGKRDARWRMPATSYAFAAGTKGEAVFVALDTTAFEGRDAAPGAAIAARARATLAASAAARWHVVFGHHPLRSSGMHDATSELARRLAPVAASDEVDLYLAGHEHFLEMLLPKDAPPMVTSGGGSGWDDPAMITHVRPESAFRLTGGGFAIVELSSGKGRVTFYDADGRRKHTAAIAPRERR
jgi:tartrate-resistant acid phosphatase type 5